MTTLVRWNPTLNTRSLRKMQTDMDRLIESFFETPQVSQTTHGNLPLDIIETETSYLISAAVPGLKSEEVEITVEDGILSITGELRSQFASLKEAEETNESEASAVKFHLRERNYGNFDRKLRLPKDVNINAISASQEDGVLTVTLAKSEATLPRKITIS